MGCHENEIVGMLATPRYGAALDAMKRVVRTQLALQFGLEAERRRVQRERLWGDDLSGRFRRGDWTPRDGPEEVIGWAWKHVWIRRLTLAFTRRARVMLPSKPTLPSTRVQRLVNTVRRHS
jgi:hypothetical protein